jgi:hypothetical protein
MCDVCGRVYLLCPAADNRYNRLNGRPVTAYVSEVPRRFFALPVSSTVAAHLTGRCRPSRPKPGIVLTFMSVKSAAVSPRSDRAFPAAPHRRREPTGKTWVGWAELYGDNAPDGSHPAYFVCHPPLKDLRRRRVATGLPLVRLRSGLRVRRTLGTQLFLLYSTNETASRTHTRFVWGRQSSNLSIVAPRRVRSLRLQPSVRSQQMPTWRKPHFANHRLH